MTQCSVFLEGSLPVNTYFWPLRFLAPDGNMVPSATTCHNALGKSCLCSFHRPGAPAFTGPTGQLSRTYYNVQACSSLGSYWGKVCVWLFHHLPGRPYRSYHQLGLVSEVSPGYKKPGQVSPSFLRGAKTNLSSLLLQT